ncbi:hypothetical protein LOZ80_07470 [Paenibacillus sp. HWE-109]|uniref:hypothetical protein n=1 Tax=Paenibacillus sp. HWE-109 TaxID=1306526 RepID=UPI001EDE420A|nr:hypothetical protein [Paenibacillus sp. HWE-109]UKS28755.1 hypothetical protein LOZ80_07470 [Paenibacillus sp. HWE-109]
MLTLKSWTSIFHRAAPAFYLTVKVRAPRDYFDRADVFIEDLLYTTEEELPGLNKTFLVKLLFDNFLSHVRQGKDMYDYMLNLKSNYEDLLNANTYVKERNLSFPDRVPNFQWSLPGKGGVDGSKGYLTLNVGLRESEVKRVDVFFADWVCNYEDSLDMDIHKLLSLLFIEFITEMRHGFTGEMIAEIVASILAKSDERK